MDLTDDKKSTQFDEKTEQPIIDDNVIKIKPYEPYTGKQEDLKMFTMEQKIDDVDGWNQVELWKLEKDDENKLKPTVEWKPATKFEPMKMSNHHDAKDLDNFNKLMKEFNLPKPSHPDESLKVTKKSDIELLRFLELQMMELKLLVLEMKTLLNK